MAEVETGGTIGTWVNGTDVCSCIRINDIVDVIFLLVQSDFHGAANIGSPQYATVNELLATVADAAGPKIHIKHFKSPVGVHFLISVATGSNPLCGNPRSFSKKVPS